MYRDTTNVEPEMHDCASNNWSHWNSNDKLKEKFGNCTGLFRYHTHSSHNLVVYFIFRNLSQKIRKLRHVTYPTQIDEMHITSRSFSRFVCLNLAIIHR